MAKSRNPKYECSPSTSLRGNGMAKRKRPDIFISHVMFPWENFQAQKERDQRERKNGGKRWTEEFQREVRGHILRYSAIPTKGDYAKLALRNSCLNDVYRLVPYHYRKELFQGVYFPIFGED